MKLSAGTSTHANFFHGIIAALMVSHAADEDPDAPRVVGRGNIKDGTRTIWLATNVKWMLKTLHGPSEAMGMRFLSLKGLENALACFDKLMAVAPKCLSAEEYKELMAFGPCNWAFVLVQFWMFQMQGKDTTQLTIFEGFDSSMWQWTQLYQHLNRAAFQLSHGEFAMPRTAETGDGHNKPTLTKLVNKPAFKRYCDLVNRVFMSSDHMPLCDAIFDQALPDYTIEKDEDDKPKYKMVSFRELTRRAQADKWDKREASMLKSGIDKRVKEYKHIIKLKPDSLARKHYFARYNTVDPFDLEKRDKTYASNGHMVPRAAPAYVDHYDEAVHDDRTQAKAAKALLGGATYDAF